MPLPMVHLAVAHRLAGEPGFSVDPAPFFLGAISPDAIHMREGITRADKNITHLRKGEAEEWRDNVLAFLAGRQRDDGFLLGYCVHILTDIAWRESLFQQFEEQYARDPAPVQERGPAYYNDTDLLDLRLFAEEPWRPEMWSLLSSAKPAGLEGLVTAEEVSRWNRRTLDWYDGHSPSDYFPPRYLTMEQLTAFIEMTSGRISAILSSDKPPQYLI